MPGEEERRVIVVRFSPFGVEGLTNNMTKQVVSDGVKQRTARHGVSVFGIVPEAEESEAAAFERLCVGVRLHASGKLAAVTSERELNEHGYCLHETTPPEWHYLVGGEDLGAPPPDLNVLAEIFSRDRRDNPGFEKGK